MCRMMILRRNDQDVGDALVEKIISRRRDSRNEMLLILVFTSASYLRPLLFVRYCFTEDKCSMRSLYNRAFIYLPRLYGFHNRRETFNNLRATSHLPLFPTKVENNLLLPRT